MPPKKQNTSEVASSGASSSELASFETEFERLGSIVERLESGNIPLEEMLKMYEEGMILSERLNGLLKEAELRVQKLAKVHEELTSSEEASFETFLSE